MNILDKELRPVRAAFEKQRDDGKTLLDRQAEMKIKVSEALDLTTEHWRPGFAHPTPIADCFVQMEADDLSAAMVIMERMGPMNLVMINNGVISFRLAEWPQRGYHHNLNKGITGDLKQIDPYTYWLKNGPHSTKTNLVDLHELRFFVNVIPYVVEVRVTVKDDPDTKRYWGPEPVRSRVYPRKPLPPRRLAVDNCTGYFGGIVRWTSSKPEFQEFTLYNSAEA